MINPRVTKIRFYGKEKDKFLCYVSVVFDDNFIVNGLKLVRCDDKILLAMPTKENIDGNHIETVHPLSKEYREYLETKIIEKYLKSID